MAPREARPAGRSGREAILAAVREGLRSARPHLELLANTAPHDPPPYVHAPTDDLVAQMASELERLDAHVYRCAESGMALEVIRRILTSEHADAIIAWDDADVGLSGLDALVASLGIQRLPLDARGPAMVERPDGAGPSTARTAEGERTAHREAALQELATAQVGITGVDVAIAESGTLLIAGGKGRGRLGSLLAPVHIAVAVESQIVRGLGEALARLRTRHGGDLLAHRSNLTCITGPSRTADIELTLTLGVHGPRALHVILLAH